MDLDKQIIIDYDIETFIKIFCVVFKYDDRYLVFEISERKNQTKELREFIRKGIKKGWLFCGFNNVRFDAQIIQWILDHKKEYLTCKEIHGFTQQVIEKANSRQFPPYPEYKLQFKQLDLYLQNHYNNLARATSLKWLEYSMNWSKVQDLPYKHDDTMLDMSAFDSIIEYCKNDVDATSEFRKKSKKLIELRFSQHNLNPELNLFNKSDSSVGETLFLDLMADKLGVDKKNLKKKQTTHKKIHLKDVILPYVNFKTETFNNVLNYFKGITITDEEPNFKYIVPYDGIDYVYGVGGLHASVSNKIVEEDHSYMILDIDANSYYPHLSFKNNFYPKHLSEEFCKLYEEKYEERKLIPKSNPQNTSIKLLLNSLYGKSGDKYSFVYDKFFMMCITVNGQLLLSMLAERMSFIEGVKVFYANTDGISIKLPKTKKKEVYSVWKWWENLTKIGLEHAVYKKMIIKDVNNYIALLDNGKVKLKGTFEIDVDYHKNRSQRIVSIAVKRYFIDNIAVEDTIRNHLNSKEKGYNWDEEKQDFEIENQGIYDFCIGKKIKWNQKYTLEEQIERELPRYSEAEKIYLLKENDWYENFDSYTKKIFWKNNELHSASSKGDTFSSAFSKLLNKIHPDFNIIKNIDDKVIRFFISSNGNHLTKNYKDGRRETTVGGHKVTMFMDYYEIDNYNIDYDYYIKEANKIVHEVDGKNERLAEEAKKEREKLKIEKEKQREDQKKQREEKMFIKYCIDKSPTQKQYERYAKEWLLKKYGEIKEIR